MSFCREWYLKSIGDYETLIREREELSNEVELNNIQIDICSDVLKRHGINIEEYSEDELNKIIKAMLNFANPFKNNNYENKSKEDTRKNK